MTALRRRQGERRSKRFGATLEGFTPNRPSSVAWFMSGVLALLLVAGWLSRLV